MNYKDKAKELVDKYASIVPNVGYYTDDGYIVEDDNIDTTKQCAIIACDEIIKTYTNEDKTYWLSPEEVNYWQQVKQAINELL